MRIRIEGKATLDAALSAITDAFNQLRDDDVRFVSDMNFYLTVYDSTGDEIVLVNQKTGSEVEFVLRCNIPKPRQVESKSGSRLTIRNRSNQEVRSAA